MHIKQFLTENEAQIKPLINNKNFKQIYDILNKARNGFNYLTSNFTMLMFDLGIDPLKYMDYIPDNYLLSADIDSFTVPKHIKKIGKFAFNDARLKHIYIPQDCELLDIEYGAFNFCDLLTEIELPDKVRYIRDHAFTNCRRLEKIFIPESVIDIGRGAFEGCPADIKIVNEGEDNIYQAFHVKPGDYEINMENYGLNELKVDWFHGWSRSNYRNNIWE